MSLEQAPICFGAITMFAEDSDGCLACASFMACRPEVENNIKQVSVMLDIDTLLMEHRKRKPQKKPKATPVVPAATIEAARIVISPPKATTTDDEKTEGRRLLREFCKGVNPANLQDLVKRGQNPYDRAMKLQWLVFESAKHGILNRATVDRLMQEEGQSQVTTKGMHIALTALGLLKEGLL